MDDAPWRPCHLPCCRHAGARLDAGRVDRHGRLTVGRTYVRLLPSPARERSAPPHGAGDGCLIVDAEPHWFGAVAEYGEDALVNVGEVVHPNLFGFQQSCHRAIDAFAKALKRPAIFTRASALGQAVKRVASNETYASTTRATSSVLQFSATPDSVYEVEIELHYNVPRPKDMRVSWEVPAGASGRFSGIGSATTATAVNNSEVVSRSAVISGNMPFGGNTSDAVAPTKALAITGATGGTIGLQIGLDAGAGTATVYGSRSTLRARRLD